MESMYKAGFEELCIAGGSVAANEAVISSVVPLDGELLIVGNVETIGQWRHICHNLSISASVVDGDGTSSDLLDALDAILSSNNRITHIVCSSERSEANLAALGMMARRYKRSLIVENAMSNIVVSDMNKLNIDFLIGNNGNVTARRSKLVQAEGNARTSAHDIYALWQCSMSERRATLEPMAC